MDKVYKSEEEFLKDYNPMEYEKLSMTADILVFSVSSEEVNNYRKTEKQKSQDKKAVFKENTPISAKKSKKVQKSRKIFKKSVA